MNATQLWDILFSKEHLKEHFEEKVKIKSSVGLDKISSIKFQQNFEREIDIIERKINNDTYQFTRYRQILFSKGAGKKPRIVSVPTVRDKLVTSVLNELLVEVFGEQSKTKLPQVLVADILKELRNYDSYIKIDISSFYASIDHEKLIRVIRRKIRKKQIVSLIQKAIKTETIAVPIKEKREKQARGAGIPEGLPISNALANIYMSDLDNKYETNSKIKYYRYVDDILILVNNDEYEFIKENLISDIKKLKLTLNDEKIENGNVCTPFSYLGYFMCTSYITVRKNSVYRLETSIEELLKSCKKGNLKYIEWKLNLKITGFVLDENKYGWMFFYSQITDLSVLHHLDWLVEKLLKRYGLIEKIKVKKYVRSYYEITKKLHDTKYIPNLNLLSLEDKRKLITEVYEQQLDDISESKVEYLFRKIMKREIQDIERDVEHIS